MATTIKLSEVATMNIRYTAKYFDDAHNQVNIDGPQDCTSSNALMAAVFSQDDSGMDRVVVYELFPVAGTVTVGGSGDADMGAGKRLLSWSDDITIVPDEAESVEVSVGELIPK
jgi:hypothetical protein